ncbi:MmcQ/YjbR family DNA-binding protein [Parabacteroides sp. PF5-9]|uniref:MmcQ/YjbR family DNA-binding protein n=1 Tax=Parabacteroides sp. PF5-9 TaxID=1742404 RepID=UPI00247531F4|nr:MmcQ/YjbR family DNA-binding protein [Parabacteroides sp. PF5-9]MDH6356679.1 putative DNA-binding protein (MmcQ/YjbR family) [Parabacteroides sp. PF5-9]
MNIEEIRAYCLALKNTTESFPFDDQSLVFKVDEKMYLLLPLEAVDPSITVKCEPEKAEELRARYNAVEPAYHFNKKHWNSILLNSDMTNQEIKTWIDHSYWEVIRKLPKKKQQEYGL